MKIDFDTVKWHPNNIYDKFLLTNHDQNYIGKSKKAKNLLKVIIVSHFWHFIQ